METPSLWAIKGKSNASFSFFKRSLMWDFKRFSLNDTPQIHPHQVYHQQKKQRVSICLTAQLNRFCKWKKTSIIDSIINVCRIDSWLQLLWATDANAASSYGWGILHLSAQHKGCVPVWYGVTYQEASSFYRFWVRKKKQHWECLCAQLPWSLVNIH